MEVFGVGILLTGRSGVGKSETAMELIKRGHRLIADDSVIIKEIANELYGTAPDIIRYFMELRGIGIINVKSMYGSGSVLDEKKIQLVIQLENWQQGKEYDRIGDEMSTTSYFDIKVPKLTIPVSPGRNLAIIIEVAARNFRLKSMGYDASEELITRSIGR
jgi:HPr kinase/phosphorylase